MVYIEALQLDMNNVIVTSNFYDEATFAYFSQPGSVPLLVPIIPGWKIGDKVIDGILIPAPPPILTSVEKETILTNKMLEYNGISFSCDISTRDRLLQIINMNVVDNAITSALFLASNDVFVQVSIEDAKEMLKLVWAQQQLVYARIS